MDKILITGGAGFIGSHLAGKLVNLGHEVTVLDNLSPQIHGTSAVSCITSFEEIRGRVNFIKGTVTNSHDLQKALADNTLVIHLAAETGTGQSMYEIHRYTDVNITGTANLLELLVEKKHHVKKLILASSRAVYGEGKYWSEELGVVYPEGRSKEDMLKGDFEVKYPGCHTPLQTLATDEESKLHPSSVYGITKLNQEQLVATVCRAIDLPYVVLRFQNVYGPGQSLTNPYTGLLAIFSTLIKNGRPLNVFEDGFESRDFVYIDDAVEAIYACMKNNVASSNIFNVGSGTAISLKVVVEELMKSFHTTVPVTISGDFRMGDIRHNYADINRIQSQVGFTPTVPFDEGVQKFVQWANKFISEDNQYADSIHQMKKTGLLIQKVKNKILKPIG